MEKPNDFTRENLDPYVHKPVVVTYKDKDKGSDAQIVRGRLDGMDGEENGRPVSLVIRNESGDRLTISLADVENIREDELID